MSADPFDAYAVRTRWGPHVTLQAGVVHLGRHWTTTTRQSVKVRSIRRLGWASTTVADHGRQRLIGGPAEILDPSRPWTWAATPVAGALAGGAVLRLGAGRLDQVLGYAEVGRGVPDAFKPWGRVLLVIDIRDELVLDGGRVVNARGRWTADAPLGVQAEPERSWGRLGDIDRLPDDVARLGDQDGECWLGLSVPTGALTVPGRWDATTGTVRVADAALRAVTPRLPGSVCVTLHESTRRRPDQKLGVMLRGGATLVDTDGVTATVALELERVTYWRGFVTSTVAVAS